MGEGDSKIEEEGARIEPISLDDWQAKPVSLDNWVVEDDAKEAEAETQTTFVGLPVSAQPVSLDDWEPQAVSLEDWSPSEGTTRVEVEEPEESPVPTEPAPPSEENLAVAEEELVLDPEERVLETPVTEIEGESDLDSSKLEKDEPLSLQAEDLAPAPLDDELEEEMTDFSVEEGEESGLDIDFAEDEDEDVKIDLSLEEDSPIELDPDEVPAVDPEDEGGLELEDTDQLEIPQEKPEPESLETELSHDEDAISLGDSDEFHASLELSSEAPENIDTALIELESQEEFFEEQISTEELDAATPEHSESDVALQEEALIPGLAIGSPIADELEEDEPLTKVEESVVSPTLAAISLGESDLAIAHQKPLLRLQADDLRENSHLAVLRLGQHDLASEHRVVHELEVTFFEEHGIAVNADGVILLEATDLAHEEEEAEARTPRSRKRTREVKESYWTNERISKFSLYAIIFCIFAIPTVYHFKYTWSTVDNGRYAEIKEEADTVDWFMKTMFKYRTPESSFRWFGRHLLTPDAYQRAESESSMMWLRYANSGRVGQGDSSTD